MKSPVWRGRDEELRPFGNIKASDSANLDMIAEVRSSFCHCHFVLLRGCPLLGDSGFTGLRCWHLLCSC